MKLCNTLTLRTLLYGCETWAFREQDEHRIMSTEMKFMRRKAKYRWEDYKTNENTLSEFKFKFQAA
jgi:hypothetical protein